MSTRTSGTSMPFSARKIRTRRGLGALPPSNSFMRSSTSALSVSDIGRMSRKSKDLAQPVQNPASRAVLDFGHAAMPVAPLARPVERTRPEPRAVLPARHLFLCLEVAIGDGPAGFDQRAVEVLAAGRAGRKQPAVAVALPARAGDRLAADEPGQRIAGAAAAGIVGALSLRQIWPNSGASMPRSLIRSAPSVMESPSLTDARPSRLRLSDAVEPGRQEDQEAEDRDCEDGVEKPAPAAARPGRAPAFGRAEPRSQHMANNLLIIPP